MDKPPAGTDDRLSEYLFRNLNLLQQDIDGVLSGARPVPIPGTPELTWFKSQMVSLYVDNAGVAAPVNPVNNPQAPFLRVLRCY